MVHQKNGTPERRPGVTVDHRMAHGDRLGRGQADFLFFLSSSTSVNSASTTSSFFLPESAPPAAPSCACLYMASPSFIDACASVLVLAVITAGSSPLSASLRSAIAFSIARR